MHVIIATSQHCALHSNLSMKLAKLRLLNFRGFAKETEVGFDDLTMFVGKNDAGKSSLLDALNIFLGDAKVDPGDVNTKHPESGFSITCSFRDLPKEVVIDSVPQVNLHAEYLLNEQGLLEITKQYSGKTAMANEVFLVANHPRLAVSKASLLELKIADLREIAEKLVKNGAQGYENVNKRKKTELRQFIWGFEGAKDKLCKQMIPIGAKGKEDTKGLIGKLAQEFPSFALFKSDRPNLDQDAEAQDPMKMAVKLALEANQEDLNALAKQITGHLNDVASRTLVKLKDISPDLAKQIEPEFPEPKWENAFKISLRTDDNVPVNKRGSGTRRLILLSFFQAEAERVSLGKNNIIYGVEEPEASQHPNSQSNLIRTFQDIVEKEKYQIILTTHTPVLARQCPIRSLRYSVIRDGIQQVIENLSDELIKEISATLGVLPNHDIKLFLLHEGKTDINYLKAFSKKCEAYPDIEKYMKTGQLLPINMFGKGNLQYCANILALLDTPTIAICDGDNKHDNRMYLAKLDSKAIFYTSMREMENYIHPSVIESVFNINFSDAFDMNSYSTIDISRTINDRMNDKERLSINSIKYILSKKCACTMTFEQMSAIDTNRDIDGWMNAIKNALCGE